MILKNRSYRLTDNVHISARLEPVVLPPLQGLALQSDGARGADEAGGEGDRGGLLLEREFFFTFVARIAQ